MSVKEIAKHIAMVHQANTAPADITVRRLVEYGRMPHQTMFSSDDKDAKEIVDWALEVTRLTGMADKCAFGRRAAACVDCNGAGAEDRYTFSR